MAKAIELKLKEGDVAPEFSVNAGSGKISLADYLGKNVILYFYPRDDTPGCTKEACAFRDNSKKFTKADTVIVGVSPDKSAAQASFKTKYDLPFTLLADADHAVAEAWGVWKEKSMYGRKYMGVERTTFLIDKKGKVLRIFPKVKIEGHADEVLKAVAAL